MAASTVEELGDDLADGLQWRRSELQVLRSEVRGILPADSRSPASRAMLRASVVMLYAHWEGFVKQGCQAYLDFVAKRKLTYLELSPALVATSVKPMIEHARTDVSQLNVLAELIAGDGTYRARVPRSKIVDTKSNLRHEVLLEILGALGLSINGFETSANLIDRELCDRRNDIAHGKDAFPDKDSVEQLFDRVLPMMELVKDLVVEAASVGGYRR
jgi:hypothetical protein